MANVAVTPRKQTKPVSARSAKKSAVLSRTTILTKDFDQSYLEQEDETYVFDDSMDDDLEIDENLTEVESDLAKKDESVTVVSQEVEESPELNIKEFEKELSPFRQFLVKHEVMRKTLHSSIGFAAIGLYIMGTHTKQTLVPLIGLFIVLLTNDIVRFQLPEFNRLVVRYFFYIARQKEVDHFNGTVYYLGGLLLVIWFLPKDLVLMSVFLLSWADTAASTFGRQFGKYTFQIAKGKSFAGALASFTAGLLSCYLLYGVLIPAFPEVNSPGDIAWSPETSKLGLHTYALLCGAVASFSESVNLYGLDDNFTIPVISGFLLNGVVKWLSL